MARVRDDRLTECSGLAASRRNPGLLWAHNDSGDSARLFALDLQGRARAVLQVAGARAVDWEDIAAGPGPDGRPSLYIGDIGNNAHRRTDLTVYCIPEPQVGAEAGEMRSEPAVAYPFSYPDGDFDAEALMVHPRTGDLYLIAKVGEEKTGIYRFPRPLQPGRRVTLERAGTLTLRSPAIWGRLVTAADIAPDGSRCVVRTYLSLLEYRVPKGRPFVAAFAVPPRVLPPPLEIQGEAAAYLLSGKEIVTSSEGRQPPLHRVPCAPER